MADNAQKIPFARYLNLSAQKKVLDAIQLLGKALPCRVVSSNGLTVVVKFELANVPFTLPQVTMPIASSQYDRIPLQAGDPGVTLPAAAYLGGVSGLGGGTADLSSPANLSALVFVPIENTGFAAFDATKRVLYGQTGVQIADGQVIKTKRVSGNYELTVNDYAIVELANGIISMYDSPENGRAYIVKSAKNITTVLTGNGNSIDDEGTQTLGGSQGTLVFYDGDEWRMIPSP